MDISRLLCNSTIAAQGSAGTQEPSIEQRSIPPTEEGSEGEEHQDGFLYQSKFTITVPIVKTRLRSRQALPQEQREILEALYRSCPYPSLTVRRELAEAFNITPRKVQIWFQNRRAKHKGSESSS
ncbi:paired mesoderm homeobox protein 2-like [Planoprotostelium fungivorum]|uniref:Paired mesoderm homeobox protein 2-like n=1 Tax=Planoprotostelium fungivorum TaxID=1890364 RepID=A0A2P6N152_9EUKA|nr:paired mesoderm homeobox protein 2-like [Planoprotostelium fungivorum]